MCESFSLLSNLSWSGSKLRPNKLDLFYRTEVNKFLSGTSFKISAALTDNKLVRYIIGFG